MLLEIITNILINAARITYLSGPVLMMVLGSLLLVAVQGARQWMKRKERPY
jgi:hypothetical protein